MPSERSVFTIRALQPHEDRSGFACGNDDLDRFFHRFAGQNQFKTHIGVTYVAVDPANAILGFVTVAPCDVTADALPGKQSKRLPAYPIPALRLARLGVDRRAAGLGIGGALVNAVFDLAHQQAQVVGCTGVLVDAKASAIGFYEQLGFVPLAVMAGELGDRPVPTPMFIWLHDIPPMP